MNLTSVKTLYQAEMARSLRTILQSVVKRKRRLVGDEHPHTIGAEKFLTKVIFSL